MPARWRAVAPLFPLRAECHADGWRLGFPWRLELFPLFPNRPPARCRCRPRFLRRFPPFALGVGAGRDRAELAAASCWPVNLGVIAGRSVGAVTPRYSRYVVPVVLVPVIDLVIGAGAGAGRDFAAQSGSAVADESNTLLNH